MSAAKVKRDEMVAWFANKAAMPHSESTQLLVRHLQCETSLRLSAALAKAIDESNQSKAITLPSPSDMLAPLA
jgi:hypothetical protein